MTNTTDFTAMFKDVLGSFPVDTSAMDGAFKSTASLNEKLSTVALSAAEQSTAVSNKWAADTLAKLTDMAKAKAEPADYAKQSQISHLLLLKLQLKTWRTSLKSRKKFKWKQLN